MAPPLIPNSKVTRASAIEAPFLHGGHPLGRSLVWTERGAKRLHRIHRLSKRRSMLSFIRTEVEYVARGLVNQDYFCNFSGKLVFGNGAKNTTDSPNLQPQIQRLFMHAIWSEDSASLSPRSLPFLLEEVAARSVFASSPLD